MPSFVVSIAVFGLRLLNTQPEENAVKHVHDPCIAKEGAYYYVFSTGHGIPIRRSKDLAHWEFVGRAFQEDVPAWGKAETPKTTMPWAPDILRYRGKWLLTYSLSSFGSNRSIIGLATNKTLDPQSKEYAWRDEGKIFESLPANHYNAIDSNLLPVGDNRLLMTFGSFWSGIKLLELNPATIKPLHNGEPLPIAQRPFPDAIEAPFLFYRKGYYYLFVSFDFCCRGADSTYHIRVGRSRKAEGPYLDREGKPLLEGGGALLLKSNGRYAGTGHCAILQDGKRTLLVHHFYDKEDKGVPTLQIRPLLWDAEGWVSAGEPLKQAPLKKEKSSSV